MTDTDVNPLDLDTIPPREPVTVAITHSRLEGTLLEAGRRLNAEAVEAIHGGIMPFR